MSDARLFLIDAHALCYRSYFAIKGLATSKGQATNAVYGFVNTLRKILRDYHPDYLAVCFDVGKKTYRQEKFAEYKIQRPSMPDNLISQIPIIKDIVSAYNLAVYEKEGFEADDIIATITQRVSKKDNVEVVIVSEDKDMYQLANKKVKLFSVRQDTILDHDEVKKRFGIEPQQMPDYIGLAGDGVDNIPGVHGIGDVTAKNLIQEYGNLENILNHLDRVAPLKVQEKIKAQKELAQLSKELALLETNVPIEFDLQDMKVKNPDHNRLFFLFKELEFKKFSEELSKEVSEPEKIRAKTIDKTSDIKAIVAQILKKGRFAFLTDKNEEGENLFSGCSNIALSFDGQEAYDIAPQFFQDLKAILEAKDTIQITHDSKNTMKALEILNCELKGKIFDVMLAGYLLFPSQNAYDLDTLAWNYLKKSISTEESLAKGVLLVHELYTILFEQLKEKSLLKLFEEIEIPLAHVLFRMEQRGVNLDTQLLKQMSEDCEEKINALTKKLFQLAGEEFNFNSPKQLSQLLFEKLKLPTIKRTKTGFSTDEGVLTKLAEQHEVPRLILEYRQLAKLKSTYIDALPKLINPKTGRVHASFNQAGTETGRLSSNHPNLQNIPIRTDLGRRIRQAFIPSQKDYLIIAADYSQIELRILAHLSQDENLTEAFKQDQDIHRFTAALIFDVKEEDVLPEMRDTAKRVNFGIIYGMSAFGLAKDLGIPQEAAAEFIDKYFLRYPKVKKFMEDQILLCQEKGYVVTLLNRRRYIPEINSANISIRQFAERQAINTPVQGSAADLMKLAMIQIQRELEKQKLKSSMIITVHDELVFDVPQKEKDKMADLIRQQMEGALKLSVPIKVSVKVGRNWLETVEI